MWYATSLVSRIGRPGSACTRNTCFARSSSASVRTSHSFSVSSRSSAATARVMPEFVQR
ncbi:Uncharacterised protein [Mycobacteroides abscessus]|nr:Uncharacterised protein [Mycobacteroides abscessus]